MRWPVLLSNTTYSTYTTGADSGARATIVQYVTSNEIRYDRNENGRVRRVVARVFISPRLLAKFALSFSLRSLSFALFVGRLYAHEEKNCSCTVRSCYTII